MPAKISRRIRKKDFPKFGIAAYSKIHLSELTIYAAAFLLEKNVEVAPEDVVFACFRLFPKKFALKKYPQLPDASVALRGWQYCRAKKYVTFHEDVGFKLTSKGERIARKTAKALGIKTAKPTVKPKSDEKSIEPAEVVFEVKPIQSDAIKPVEKPTTQKKVVEKKEAAASVEAKPIQPESIKPVEKPAKQKKVVEKKEAVALVEAQPIQSESIKPVEKPAKQKKVAKKKEAAAPVEAKPIRSEAIKPVEKPAKQKKVVEKKEVAAPVDAKPIQPESIKPVEKPAKQKKVVEKKEVPVTAETKPTQLTLLGTSEEPAGKTEVKRKKSAPSAQPIWREKITPPQPTVGALPERSNLVGQESVSPEVKIRAGKFIRMMESSDAYVQYRQNGAKARISEFDFRNLLLCTMESSAEALARNVEQFKSYAGIQQRQDLIAFLDFCGEQFAYLLTPPKKTPRKK